MIFNPNNFFIGVFCLSLYHKLNIMNVVKFLDWIVAMNFQHYETESFPDYTPSGSSHFYLFGSPERFTSEELENIYTGKMDDELRERWNWALIDKKK